MKITKRILKEKMSHECICQTQFQKRIHCSRCRKGFNWEVPDSLKPHFCKKCKVISICGINTPLCPDCISQGWRGQKGYGGPTLLIDPNGNSHEIEPDPCKKCNTILDEDEQEFVRCRCEAYSGLHYKCLDPSLTNYKKFQKALKEEPEKILNKVKEFNFEGKIEPGNKYHNIHLYLFCNYCKE